jgi:hypothetical protein
MFSMLYVSSFLGFGIEVFFILMRLGIPVFFIWRWIFRKSIIADKRRKIAVWTATILSTPIVYALVIAGWFWSMSYYPNRHFNKKKWIDNKDQRYEYSNDIISSKMLVGKTKTDVIKTLGDEANLDSSDDCYYDLGFRPGIGNIDSDNLEITFKNGKVVAVIQNKR